MIRFGVYLLLAIVSTCGARAADDGFARALPGYAYQFPRDHGAHPEFKTEWWYFTGNLESDDGKAFGYELTFFRQGLIAPGMPRPASPLLAHTVYFAHFAISDIGRGEHRFWERNARPAFDQADYSRQTLDLRLHDWQAWMDEDGKLRLRAEADGAGLVLTLAPEKPLVIHGEAGVHQKANDPGQASHYLSFTRLKSTGKLQWRGREFTVSGLSWMDHEFGSDQLAENQIGWHWFALQLAGGQEIMLYQIRLRDGGFHPVSRGTLVHPDGSTAPLPARAYALQELDHWQSPATGAIYPIAWRIELPEQQAELVVRAAFPEQEMRTTRTAGGAYWEGAVRVEGNWEGEPARGVGYVELVGHAGEFAGL